MPSIAGQEEEKNPNEIPSRSINKKSQLSAPEAKRPNPFDLTPAKNSLKFGQLEAVNPAAPEEEGGASARSVSDLINDDGMKAGTIVENVPSKKTACCTIF